MTRTDKCDREQATAVRVAFTAAVGSHLDTAGWIERALRQEFDCLESTVVDLAGFSTWNAQEIAYTGQADRLTFDLEACGLSEARIDSLAWRSVRRGAVDMLERVQPDILVTMDDSWYDQYALILAARRTGVPSVLVQEGPFTDSIDPVRNPRRRSSLSRSTLTNARLVRRLRGRPVTVRLPTYGRGGTSRVLAVSEWYRSRFIAAGVPPHSVEVAGIPRYDAIPRLREQWLARRRSLDPAEPRRVMLLSQPFVRYKELSEAEYLALATIAREAVTRVSDAGISVEVRLHPSDTPLDAEALVGQQSSVTVVAPSEPLLDRLPSFDAVVGFSSSGLLEAMAIGLPVVVIETPSIAARTRFFREAGVPVVADIDDARIQITRAATSVDSIVLPPRAADEMGVLDGRASARVASHCRALVAADVAHR